MKLKKRLISRGLKALFLVFLMVCLAWGLLLFLKSNFWTIKRVSCELACSLTAKNQLEQRALGKNLLFLPIKKITRSLLQDNPTIEKIQLKRRLPDELILAEEKRQPVVALMRELFGENEPASESAQPKFSTEEEQLVVDKEGFILSKVNSSSLPKILLRETLSLNIGEQISKPEIIRAINVLTGLKLFLQDPKVARIASEQSLRVWFGDNQEVLFSLKKEVKIQLDSLQLILSRAKIEGKKIKRLDLRFDKPVVIYE